MTSRADAEAMDATDPLAAYRGAFVVDDPTTIYLDGNSLGRLPARTVARLRTVVDIEWGSGLVGSWQEWIGLPGRVGDLLAGSVLGAGPGEVIVSDSTTVNLYKLAAAALDARPGRDVIIGDEHDFPTDRYVLEGLARARGLELRLLATDPVEGPGADEIAAALDERVALVCLSHAGYRSGALAGVPAITRAARNVGAMALWDLSHSVGSVPIDLAGWGVELAVGCTYKYLNGGPGSPAFLYVRRELHDELRQPVWGWFGRADQFAMGAGYRPKPGIERFLAGSPPVLQVIAVEEGARLVEEAGLERLRAKSVALTGLACELAGEWLARDGFALGSPADSARRGGHVSLRHPEAYRLTRALIDRAGVICDYREPDTLRLAPAPLYTRFVDVWDAFDRLRSIVAAGIHLVEPPNRREVT